MVNSSSKALIEELKAGCPTLRVHEYLGRHTSLGIGGPADYYADVNGLDELIALRRVVERHKIPVFFIGAGSNLLISDQGIRGLVIHLQGDFRNIEVKGEKIQVGAGTWMPALSRRAADHGLAGLEALIGVPGTVGGGLVMNAGTRDGWIGNVVVSVDVMEAEGTIRTLYPADLGFQYRHSLLEGYWVVGCTLKLKSEDKVSILQRIKSSMQYRSRTQPLATSNCGSVFKNPPEGPAAQWIEKAGLKGLSVGGARVSDRHANFILNEKNATAQDVRTLIKRIQDAVHEKFNIRLEPEVKLVGQW